MLIITIRIPYHVLFFHNGYKIYPYIREYRKEVFVMELSSFARIGKAPLQKPSVCRRITLKSIPKDLMF